MDRFSIQDCFGEHFVGHGGVGEHTADGGRRERALRAAIIDAILVGWAERADGISDDDEAWNFPQRPTRRSAAANYDRALERLWRS